MRYTVLLLALLGPIAPLAAQDTTRRPVNFYVDSNMLKYLEQIAETTTAETARCIMGSYDLAFDAPTRFVSLDAIAETPWLVVVRTDTSVFWDPHSCPEATLALWHAHPLKTVLQRDKFDWRVCGISKVDESVMYVYGLPPIQLISIQRKKSCLFVVVDGHTRLIDIPRR